MLDGEADGGRGDGLAQLVDELSKWTVPDRGHGLANRPIEGGELGRAHVLDVVQAIEGR